MQVNVEGKGKISFGQNDFIATGGESAIYGKGHTIYKIYHKVENMIPLDKIQELKILDKRNILRPLDIIRDKNDVPIGFTMDWITNTIPLCKLFTNDYRDNKGITPETTLELVERMITDVKFIHEKGCLIVDANEFNFLTDSQTHRVPFFIDVNSYQTPHFNATALMPSVRDYQTKGFSDLTDWYAIGIVTFQLFVGIHPYKGNHPDFPKKNYKNNKAGLLKDRMLANTSVYNTKTSLPSAARDFSLIPIEYDKWYIEMFEKGKRIPPPSVAGMLSVTPVKIEVVTTTNNFIINLLKEYDTDIIKSYSYNSKKIVVTKDKLYIGKVDYPSTDPNLDVIFSPRSGNPLVAQIKKGFIQFTNIETKENLPANIKARSKTIIDNTLYVLSGENFMEISISELSNNKIIPSVKTSWNVLPHATTMFEGVIYQNLLGKPYLMIPYKLSGSKRTSCMIRQFPELEGYTVIDAKHKSGICIVIGHKDNKYDKFIFRFSDDYKTHKCRIETDVDLAPINFITLENGICVSITEEDAIEIFSRKNDQVKRIQDLDINNSMMLCRDGVNVEFFHGPKLYSLKINENT